MEIKLTSSPAHAPYAARGFYSGKLGCQSLMDMPEAHLAIAGFDDTCGNFIQIPQS